jgi:imidazolonepropionase-like amidohydrolase
VIGLAFLALAPLMNEPAAPAQEENTSWKIHAEWIYTAAGDPIEGGIVTVQNGKITSVTKGGGSGGKNAINVAAVTPGMVDLSARVHGGNTSVEQSREVQPHRSVEASIDLYSNAWERQVRSGVTTALINPVDRNVIGGLGVVVKTAGPESLEERTLKPRAVLRGAIGTEPSRGNHPVFGTASDFYSRRPTTRMGVEWEWRKAFYDAAQRDEPVEGDAELLAALRGEIPVFIQAWATQDIRTAVFLKEEMAQQGFGEMNLTIDAGAEAWREPDLLVRSRASVILPPFPMNGRTGDGAFMAWNVAALLHDRGVPIALSGHGARDVASRIGMQAGYAMRGGLDFDAALEAVTIAPARMVGVDDRVGTIEVGKDADLVLWSGPTPFEPTSQIIGVLVDGALKLDPRSN